MSNERFTVEDRPNESRYVLIDHGEDGLREDGTSELEIGEESYVDVVSGDSTAGAPTERVLFHTGVSDDYKGQGLASVLVRGAVDHLVGEGMKIVPVCPYVVAWLPKHPEYAEHTVAAARHHLRAIREQQRQK